ncbi:YceI family protein [Dyadobacter sp. UC 10]|nr:YceI family protein [Dyadobacter sp. UC 10]
MASFTLIVRSWDIAPGYSIKFDGKYAHGTFKKLSGSIHFDPLVPEKAAFDVAIEVSSIETGIDLKNKHAKSEKWFDAERFPLITFKSSQVIRADSGYVVSGKLNMHGFEKDIAIPFDFDEEEEIFQGKFKVSRGDFGIGKVNGKASDSTAVEIFVPVFQK